MNNIMFRLAGFASGGKKITMFLIALILLTQPVFAKAPEANSSPKNREFQLPANAVKIDDDTYYLGKAKDPQTSEMVEGYVFIHHKNSPAKSGGNAKQTSICYGYLATGAKWKNVENWVINPANNIGLSDIFLLNTTAADIAKWEDAADGVVGNSLGVNRVGDGAIVNYFTDTTKLDGINEVQFGPIADTNTIAVTTVWGIFSGPTFQRKLVEWDQAFNTFYRWSASGEAGKMDYQNISTHELGHAVGMADLYTSSCAEETMYGYASLGETKKQTLNGGDILGIDRLY